MIYADNAATSRLDPEAFSAMKEFLTENYANPSQPYSFSRNSKKAIKTSRERIAECIDAEPDEIFFTSGGSESDNWAVKGINPNVIITSPIEHHAVINACEFMKRFSRSQVIYLPVNDKGTVNLHELERILKSINASRILVSVMTASNEIGTLQPVNEIAEISHKYNAVFHTDSVQAVGHMNISVKAMNIDTLSASAHKFNGPRGTGFLYVRKGTELMPLIHGGSQEKNMRAGTENTAGIAGMSAALENNCMNIKRNQNHIISLEKILLEGLNSSGLDFIINGDEKNKLPGIISVSFKHSDGEMIMHRLDLMNICVSTGSACDGERKEISHVIRSIHVPDDYSRGTIRISLGKYNSHDDVSGIVNALKKILLPFNSCRRL